MSSASRLLLERARGRLYRQFGRVAEIASRFRLGRRLPILRRVYFALVALLRPGVVAIGPWTVYFHRGDNAISHALRNAGVYEPFELELIESLLEAGDCAVDVGANIGLHTLAMSVACGERGTVLSLEPDPGNVALLAQNLEVNGCKNVELLPIAAGDRSQTLELFLNSDNRGDHRLYDPGDGRPSITVQTERLDRVLSDRRILPALIKIDVQGWERNVLRGAVPIIRDIKRFALVTEFWTEGLQNAGTSGVEYLDMLDELGLDLYEIDEKERVLRPLPGDRSTWLATARETNVLAVRGVPAGFFARNSHRTRRWPRDDGPFYAEYGEDALLASRFDNAGVFVEVGASDGVTISPTLYFEQTGWHGVLIEADPKSAGLCRLNRPNSTVIEAAVVGPGAPPTASFTVVDELPQLSSIALRHGCDWIREWEQKTGRVATFTELNVRAATLDELLAEAGVDSIDFITIDVEGHEWSVIQGFDCDRWKPSVIIIERMAGRRPDPQIAKRLRGFGYVFTQRTGYNDWYGPTRHTHGPRYLFHMGRAWLLPQIVIALRHPRRLLRLGTRWRRLKSRVRAHGR